MNEIRTPPPRASDWSDALLTSGTEALLGAVRNYIGPVKTPYDKRDLVARLEAFLRKAETRDSLFSLLDGLDCAILGSALLVGPVPEQALKELFAGELPLFELGVRISNLLDRLLLFRYQSGGKRLIAVNPLLEEDLRQRVLAPELVLGRGGGPRALEEGPGEEAEEREAIDARTAVGFFSFLLHSPGSTRKGGGLTKRAAERAAALFPGLSGSGNRLAALARALAASGALDAEERRPDAAAFSRLAAQWGENLPFYLAACLALGGDETAEPTREGSSLELGLVLAAASRALPELGAPRRSLSRWLRIAGRRAGLELDAAVAMASLEELGILRPRSGALSLALPKVKAEAARGGSPTLVAEGAHALHLMPEAGFEDRLFVGCLARPASLGTVWSFEIDRDSARRAFAAGYGAAAIRSRLEALSGGELPQSLRFSLAAWEEEYLSLRLYRGFVLAADERQRPIIERSIASGRIAARRLAEGVYLLEVSSPEEAEDELAAAGLEAPPLEQVGRASRRASPPAGAPGDGDEASSSAVSAAAARIDGALRDLSALGGSGPDALGDPSTLRRATRDGDAIAPREAPGRPAAPDPEARLAALRAALEASARGEEERRELRDRIERRLVLTERQIAESDPRPERLEAGGLDYLGKVRVVERALRSPGDSLELLYRLPGAEPVKAIMRPVRLDRNDKGLVLEAEDLGTGGPARVPLGAVSTVRRVRASLFGEEQ